VIRFFAHGWIHDYFLEPTHFFPYFGLDWIRPWPGPGMYVHFAAMGALAIAVALGYRYRASITAFGVLFGYAHLIDKTNYLNHYYLVLCLCFVMALLPLHAHASLDARRDPAVRAAVIPAWVLWALRAQIALVYGFGGVAKLRADWLLEAQPLRTWLAASTDAPVVGPWLAEPCVAFAMSWAGAAFDLSIVPLLLWRRSRRFAYAALVAFHLATLQLFQLGLFPWIMMSSSLLFLSPSWPREAASWLRRRGGPVPTGPSRPGAPAGAPATPAELRRASPAVRVALLSHFALQLVVPLRHWLYPGDLLWTEQGFRFAWNVMLIEKAGSVEAHVREPSTGRCWVRSPGAYLTPYQAKMMATQPDMILQFAHMVAADLRGRGVLDPEVRVHAVAALHGQRRAHLVDPEVDLAREPDGLAPRAWIYPDPERARAATRAGGTGCPPTNPRRAVVTVDALRDTRGASPPPSRSMRSHD
jgi:hypothetical protein